LRRDQDFKLSMIDLVVIKYCDTLLPPRPWRLETDRFQYAVGERIVDCQLPGLFPISISISIGDNGGLELGVRRGYKNVSER